MARKRTAEESQVEDTKLRTVSLTESLQNFRYFLSYRAPESIFRPHTKVI